MLKEEMEKSIKSMIQGLRNKKRAKDHLITTHKIQDEMLRDEIYGIDAQIDELNKLLGEGKKQC